MKDHQSPIIVILFIGFLFAGCSTNNYGTNTSPQTSTVKPIGSNVGFLTCKDGDTRSGYTQPFAHGIEQCSRVSQTCLNGMWNGPTLFPSCDNPTEYCDGTPHGSDEIGYSSPTKPCFQATRTCMDGSWIGPEVYNFCN